MERALLKNNRFSPWVGLGIWIWMLAAAIGGEPFSAKVVGVHDGDTVTVYDGKNPQLKIRLAKIDAPELKQPYGKESKAALSALIFGQTVQITPHGKDRYGRTLADIHYQGQWVNLQLVAVGAAWRYDAFSKSTVLLTAQQSAQKAQRGLWALPDPVAPWLARK